MKSVFVSPEGSNGVYRETHPEFTKVEKKHRVAHAGKRVYYILRRTEAYRTQSYEECSVPSIENKFAVDDGYSEVMPLSQSTVSKEAYLKRR